MKNQSLLGIAFLAALTAISCGKQEQEQSIIKGIGIASGELKHSDANINVCFENHGDGDEQAKPFRADMVSFLKGQFSRSVVNLTGWGDCVSFTTAKQNIRISFNSSMPEGVLGMSNIGAWDTSAENARMIGGYHYRPTLIMDSRSFMREQVAFKSPNILNVRTKNTLIHEMGHAVGLWHEHSRSSSCSATSEKEPWYDAMFKAEDFVATKEYDANSVMDYCNLDAHDKNYMQASLSSGDIETINAIFSGVMSAGIMRPGASSAAASPATPSVPSIPSIPSPTVPSTPAAPSGGGSTLEEIIASIIGSASGTTGTTGTVTPSFDSSPIGTSATTGTVTGGTTGTTTTTTTTSSGYTYCNKYQLQICLDYKGGAACYPKWCY